MKWVTREHPYTDRIACPWLIHTFIDPGAEIVYVPRDQDLEHVAREGATSFHARVPAAPTATTFARFRSWWRTTSSAATSPTRSRP
jgi:hypothetical protein